MQLGNNLLNDFRFVVKCFNRRKIRCIYLGHIWFHNLGDEALRVAIYKVFDKYLVMTIKKGMLVRLLEKLGLIKFDVLVLGGGTLIFRSERFLKQFESNEFDKKIVFGTGVANHVFWKNIPGNYGDPQRWVECLNKVKYLSVRGPISKKLLLERGVKNQIDLIGDPVLYFTRPIKSIKNLKKRMGVNVGTTGIGENRELLWGMSEEKFFRAFAGFIKIMVEDGWEVEFVPVCDEDLPSIKQTIQFSGCSDTITIFNGFKSVEKTLDRLETFDVFVGQKLHSVVLAYCANTPAVMIEYRPKCRDFMESIKMSEFNVRTDEFEKDKVKSLVMKLLNNVEEYRNQTNAICMEYKQLLSQSAEKVYKILSIDKEI